MYIFNTYKCSKTICKGKEGNEPGFKSMLILGRKRQQEDVMKGKRSMLLDVDLCDGSSFIF